ncbi:hypothetical protein BofuT4_uP048400.1 [Botrytis cinerea T4]|uniref:Uncharacterized protein n=1 Tax=Botryotinia fuckeliana (strain T4) TaxID=999810 RepID=G2XZD5_BOTF4|nr:hypothetical protein BofuT4_uP048400.1 [Botrytis cinerea T4]
MYITLSFYIISARGNVASIHPSIHPSIRPSLTAANLYRHPIKNTSSSLVRFL